MRGRDHMYLMAIGVDPAHQGKGHGGRLIREMLTRCDALGKPLYLETVTEGNVRLYEHFGFEVLERIVVKPLDHPMWEMLYEPPGPGAPKG